MKKYVTGLVVGKFCPLHKGHEYLCEYALSQCERVIILSYTSEDYGFDANTRKNWLRGMYLDQSRLDIHVIDNLVHMKDDAPDEVHRQFCADYLLETLDTTVQAVFSSESYGQGFAEHLSNYFSEKLSTPVPVEHVMVDLFRLNFPVSGTNLRSGAADLYEFVSPHVRRSFIKKILFLGGESTGKSTISESISRHFWQPLVREYGRELYVKRNGKLMYEDMTHIGSMQLKLEELAKLPVGPYNKYIFCDTSPLTTAFYSKELFGRVSRELTNMVWDSELTYHKIYLCAPDFPMVQDGTRQDETFRTKGHEFYLNYLGQTNIDYTILTGTLDEKIAKVISDLTEPV